MANIHIRAIEYLEKNNKSFVLNCGYGKGYSVLQIVKKFKKLLKWKPKYNNINKIIKSAINWEIKLKNNLKNKY